MTNEELVAELQKQYDEEKTMLLWGRIEGFVRKTAWKYVPMLRCKVRHQEDEDLLGEAYFAFNKAIKGYNPEAGKTFVGYLTFFLHSAFSDYVSKELGGSRGKSYRIKMLHKFEEDYISLTGRAPSDGEICQGLGITVDTLQSLRLYGKTESIDEMVFEDGDISRLDTIPSDDSVEDEVIDEIVRDQVHNLLRDYIDELPFVQRRIINLVYFRGFTDRKASDEIGIGYSQLLAEKKKALDTIGKGKHLRELGRLLGDKYEAIAYHGGLGSFTRTGYSSTELSAIKDLLGK